MGNLKGWIGERFATFQMWFSLDRHSYTKFHNIIVPASNGTAQLDHIVVSQHGIFIIETKNKDGWIFGSENQAKWTQTFYGKKYSFQNPLRQAFRQKKVLAEFLNVDEPCIHVVVYFVGKCSFKTQMPSNVINTGLISYIKQFRGQVLAQDEVNGVINTLEQHMAETTLTTNDHVRSLHERHNSNTVCPNCGASLKLKTAKKGPNAGAKFLGCETYPRCRFARSA